MAAYPLHPLTSLMASIGDIIQTQWQQLKDRIPQRDICLAPADAFFCECIEIPEDVSRGEIQAFAELSLEGASPFPLEQMAWGFLHAADSPHLLVYATPKNRLSRVGLSELEKWHHVFPGFASLFGKTWDRPVIVFLSQTGSISALYYEAKQSVPCRVVSRPVGADLLTDESILKAQKKLLDQLPEVDEFEIESGVYVGDGSYVHSDHSCSFKHRYLKDGQESDILHNFHLAESELWPLDIRDPEFAQKEGKSRALGKRLWTALIAASATAALLIIAQVAFFALESWSSLRERQILSLAPAVSRVEHTQTLVDRLTRSVEQDIHPFYMLQTINSERPPSVFFSKVGARAYNRLEVEGESTEGVSTVNRYADELVASSAINDVINNSQTRVGRTSFELVITFDRDSTRGEVEIPQLEEPEDAEEGNGDELAQNTQP
ncbi:MAG: hypothetical protein JJU20_03485 [Opitutales bacterium]|nr:hypothetical protein [Opitutales bacterium]